MIKELGRIGQVDKAVEMYRAMASMGVQANTITFSVLINACGKLPGLGGGGAVRGLSVASPLHTHAHSSSANAIM